MSHWVISGVPLEEMCKVAFQFCTAWEGNSVQGHACVQRYRSIEDTCHTSKLFQNHLTKNPFISAQNNYLVCLTGREIERERVLEYSVSPSLSAMMR